MVTTRDSLIESAKRFFKGMENSDNLREHLLQVDEIVQFAPSDGQPFHVSINKGRIDIGASMKYREQAEEVLYITGDEASLAALLKGDITLAESIYHLKIQVANYRNKEPRMAGFSKLLRLGLWDLVPGARVLMPDR